MSAPTTSAPARPRRIASSSREVSPPASGVPGAGRVGRIEHVDVDRHVDRTVAQPVAHPLDRRRRRRGSRARRCARWRSRGRRSRAGPAVSYSGPRMPTCRQCSRSSRPSSDGPAERRAVRVRLAEVGVPGVEVRVEVQHRERPVPACHRPQQRQRDRVVAAERRAASRRRRVSSRAPASISPIAARMSNGLTAMSPASTTCWAANGDDAQRRVVGAQQPRALPDVRRAEPRAGSVADAAVERDADDRDVETVDVLRARQPGERRQPRVPGNLRRVDRSDRGDRSCR